MRQLPDAVAKGRLTLVYGTKDEQHNQAVVLRDVLADARARVNRIQRPDFAGLRESIAVELFVAHCLAVNPDLLEHLLHCHRHRRRSREVIDWAHQVGKMARE